MSISIKWIMHRHLSQILEIEQSAFSSPWTKTDFKNALISRSIIGLAVEKEDDIVGYLIYKLHKKCFEVLNIAVASQSLRQGIGTALLTRLRNKLTDTSRTDITAVIQEENFEGLALFKKNRFVITSIQSNFYDNIKSDAYTLHMCINKKSWKSTSRFGLKELEYEHGKKKSA